MTSVDLDLLGLLIVWAHDVRATPIEPGISTGEAMAVIEAGKRGRS
ncbi:MAG TPA: hypothetical protein VHX38_02335 [Pseudonocardiaceae bacterium]|jgi:hypothetical protein|nr:hypothetical protein [Pseudonocardiaceae bacterium]